MASIEVVFYHAKKLTYRNGRPAKDTKKVTFSKFGDGEKMTDKVGIDIFLYPHYNKN